MSDTDIETDPVPRRKQVAALRRVAEFNPVLTTLIIILGTIAAILELVGLGFILPVIEIAQSNGSPAANGSGVMELFVTAYRLVGVRLTLGTVVVGVTVVMTVRYASSFLGAWLKLALQTRYIRHLQIKAFDHALDAQMKYFDQRGSDQILNAIITQTYYAGRVIKDTIRLVQITLLAVGYLLIALFISPELTIVMIIVLGILTYLIRSVLESGYNLGEEVADANEQRQSAAQAGTQGIRDIRIFGLGDLLRENFQQAVDRYTQSRVKLQRNEAVLNNFYNLFAAVSIFALIFLALRFADLSLSTISVFLFAMFQLGPRASRINKLFYNIENNMPHIVRTQEFVDELRRHKEPNDATCVVPDAIGRIAFNDVRFSYDDESTVLRGINLEARSGEFVAFVGPSGAGKSTIIELLARMYEPDAGQITANSEPIEQMDIKGWRQRVAVVRQNPFIFTETLRYNLTIANQDATQTQIDCVCEIANVDEFINDLPNGYDTQLGDKGVRLSGGQQQRVAIARALLADADILILDEATSDLDTNLEREIQQAIESMNQEYIILTIAHRLSTVKNADRIYTIERGQVVEVGKHEELLEQNGKYTELYTTLAGD